MRLTRDRLEELFRCFRDLRILVVGDFFLDKYLLLERGLTEISLETGLEAYQAVGVRPLPGAAGTVAKNLTALGVRPLALSAIGDDGEGYELERALRAFGVDTSGLIKVTERHTPTYMKPIMREPDGREHELNRIDIKNRSPTPPNLEEEIIARLRELVTGVHGVAIVDQVEEPNCGIVTEMVREEILRLASSFPGKVFIADSRARIGLFHGVIVKPNRREAALAIGLAPEEVMRDRTALHAAGEALRGRTGRPVYITAGEEGIFVFLEGACAHVPAVSMEGPIDPVGAGDAVMAALASALCAGADFVEAAELAVLVAAVTVQKIGTTGEACPDEVLSLLNEVTRA